jgi:hypothetical protein
VRVKARLTASHAEISGGVVYASQSVLSQLQLNTMDYVRLIDKMGLLTVVS